MIQEIGILGRFGEELFEPKPNTFDRVRSVKNSGQQ